jgi:hypothetical protein
LAKSRFQVFAGFIGEVGAGMLANRVVTRAHTIGPTCCPNASNTHTAVALLIRILCSATHISKTHMEAQQP